MFGVRVSTYGPWRSRRGGLPRLLFATRCLAPPIRAPAEAIVSWLAQSTGIDAHSRQFSL
jgi:hypothetical protein